MLLEFYGRECGHCKNMESLVARLENELGVKLERFETWHDQANEAKRAGYDTVGCGGVPFFMNTDTGAIICGEVPYEDLHQWATKGVPIQP